MSGPGPRRCFLGWERTPLEAAADWLTEEYGPGMGDLVVAVPGARAGRRLEELLALRAPASWDPPRVLTQGRLVDELVELERPVAGRLARTLAWERALAGLPRTQREAVARRVGAGDGLVESLRLAETVRTLHGELAPEGLSFDALLEGEAAPTSRGEQRRWEALAAAQVAYRALLDAEGLADPHEARLEAVRAGRIERGRTVVLVAVADMTRLLRELAEAIAERVVVLVAAPQELAATFDAWGRLEVAAWSRRDVPLALERWHVVEKPDDQAAAVARVLAGWGGRYAAEEVTLGLADEEVAPHLARRLDAAGVRAVDAAGTPLERSRPALLVEAVGRYLRGRRYEDFAALLRHPDLERGLRGEPDVDALDTVDALDLYHAEHLPAEVGDEWIEGRARRRSGEVTAVVRELHADLESLLGDLGEPRPRPLAAWAEPLRAWLGRVYAGDLDPDDETQRLLAEALRGIASALDELAELPASLAGPELPASEACDLLGRLLRSRSVPPRGPAAGEATSLLLGWLELPLDTAPAVVVTGFQEGSVPRSVGGDPFLPDSVRRTLELPDDEARLARDAYAATVLLETREAAFVTGRRSADGDPRVPSRLAFHAPAGETVARVRHFLPDEDLRPRPPAHAPGDRRASVLPRVDWEPPESMRVSDFGAWLSDPYRYYLERVLALRNEDDEARELDGRSFGTLTHDVLEAFGRSALKDSSDAGAIAAFLEKEVRRAVRRTYGKTPLPAIELQAEQLVHRLGILAEEQARRAAEGWTIEHVEWAPADERGVELDVDGTPVHVRGRIDRIDRHPVHGWAVLDYKTGRQGSDPEKEHRARKQEWRDLQLPLYAYLARELGYEGTPAAGYVAVGKDAGKIGFHLAGWGEGDLASALDVAREVVRSIRALDVFRRKRGALHDPLLGAIAGEGLVAAAEEDGE